MVLTYASKFRHKSFRDPLYGFIGLSEKEVRLVDTKIFRRLHRIKQLSHAHLVYPSALHTRFEHSLEAMHIAGRMCDELGLEKETVRQAALLHDIGHGPFSHLFESVLEKANPGITDIHEEITKMIIDSDQEIDSILGSSKKEVVDILRPKSKMNFKSPTMHSDIVSGSLDADKMDYLRRDSYFLGVSYGMFDLERVIYTLRPTPGNYPSLGIDSRGKDAVESYRLARHLMHTQVYEHHTRLAADRMFLQALDSAVYEEKVIASDMLNLNSDEFLDHYTKLDDGSICEMIMRHPRARKSRDILECIRQRKLPKRACQFSAADIKPETKKRLLVAKQSELDSIAKQVARGLKIQPHEIIFHMSKITIKLYDEGDIPLVTGERVQDLKQISPITAKDTVVLFYVFGPPEVGLAKICSKVADELDVDPEEIRGFK